MLHNILFTISLDKNNCLPLILISTFSPALPSFFAKHSWPVVEKISQRCKVEKNGTKLAFNLNGEYVFQDPAFVMQVVALLPRYVASNFFGSRSDHIWQI